MGLTSSWNQASCTRWGAHSAAVSSLPLAKNAVHSPSSWRAGASQPSRSNGGFFYIFVSDGHCTYRNTRLLILRMLVQFYVLPHTPTCSVCTYVCIYTSFACYCRQLAPGFRNSWKTVLKPAKQPTEVSTLIQTVGFKLIQDSELQIAETPLEELHCIILGKIVNTVGSLPLAKNALHSPTSNNYILDECLTLFGERERPN